MKTKHLGMTIKAAGFQGGVQRYRVPHLRGGRDVYPSVGQAMRAIEAARERKP